jgi:hypothetical protein
VTYVLRTEEWQTGFHHDGNARRNSGTETGLDTSNTREPRGVERNEPALLVV